MTLKEQWRELDEERLRNLQIRELEEKARARDRGPDLGDLAMVLFLWALIEWIRDPQRKWPWEYPGYARDFVIGLVVFGTLIGLAYLMGYDVWHAVFPPPQQFDANGWLIRNP